jgi:hypothetical protein
VVPQDRAVKISIDPAIFSGLAPAPAAPATNDPALVGQYLLDLGTNNKACHLIVDQAATIVKSQGQ